MPNAPVAALLLAAAPAFVALQSVRPTLSTAAGPVPAAGGSEEPLRGAPEDVRPLFLEHCAKCHGENGDGKGTTELDRPARSFLDGGFSYGNTRGAIVRSIRHGIPGTPMPAFPDEVLTAAQRDALADFVIAMGPPGTVVVPGASVLRVEDRPVVARGMLPPLAEGDERVPRGLLIGFPSGTTFEYRADDVQLRALRQGEFVDRRDWGDRGGNELRPLGRVLRDLREAKHALDPYNAPRDRRVLRSTEIHGDAVQVRYEQLDSDGRSVAKVAETLRVVATTAGPVPARSVRTTDPNGAPMATTLPEGARLESVFRGPDGALQRAHRIAEGVFLIATPSDTADVVHYAYADRWSPALEAVVRAEEAAR
jgi:mono/diheme cytochrome c family protein